ncbi:MULTISPECIES: HAMP domain-containing sensor histidine kinase [Nitrosopumilus]|nr:MULTISPECIES: HAMP domain-containing sensor histidine kinase [Nitrosopumilus]
MKNGKKPVGLILFSIIGVIIVASWILIATPMLKNNSAAFEDIREYLGEDAYAENIGDKLSEPIISSDFLEYKIVNQSGSILEIESSYITKDIITGETIYENYNTYYVDSTTRKHVDHDELYFIFPANVQKQDYFLFDPNMEVPAMFVFEGTKQIGNLEVYEFSCESIGDDFSQAWPEFLPDIVYADQTCKTSIEPVTGKTIEFAITWDMYVIKDGKHVSVEMGEAETTDFSELILLQSASDTKQLFYVYDFVVPVFLILVLVSIFFTILYINKSKEKGKIIIKQLEEMQKTEKIATIGHLASRLAHDIRNPLSVIQMTVDILRNDPEISKRFQKYGDSITESIQRIGYQVNNVLDYVQQKPLKLEKMAVSAIIDSALESLKIPENITVEKTATDEEIVCDHHMIRIVFINIITNAIYAIDSKVGKIRINVKPDYDSVKIEISNTGEPIPEKELEKIFEPLFTTKQEGTGLGLASCKSIIEQHGGTISVKNNPTTFTITLPRNQEK